MTANKNIKVSKKFLEEILKKAYSERFNESPISLINKLHQVYGNELQQRDSDLIHQQKIMRIFNSSEPINMLEKDLNCLCYVLIDREKPIPKRDRLNLVWEKLSKLLMPSNPKESFKQLCSCLDEIEDIHSRIEKQDPPPKLKEYDGRMYPPLDDFTHEYPDDSITAIVAYSKNHTVYIAPNGARKVVEKITNKIVYQDPVD